MNPLRIMIAEHDAQMRRRLAEYLKAQKGVEIQSEVANGQEAFWGLTARPPDVFITDLVLPMMDGFALLEAISETPALQKVKVIVLTSLSRDRFVERAISLGAHYYMCKPCDLSLLYCRIMESMDLMYAEDMAKTAGAGTSDLDSFLYENGIRESVKGYHYIRTAVMLGTDMKVLNGRITTELYPEIARIYGTTSGNVERAIRSAIEHGFLREQGDNALPRPTNGEYIAKLVQLYTSCLPKC